MTWVEFLRYERLEKLSHLDVLGSGRVQSFMRTDGVQRETTQENIERLTAEIAQIEQILRDAGEPIDA